MEFDSVLVLAASLQNVAAMVHTAMNENTILMAAQVMIEPSVQSIAEDGSVSRGPFTVQGLPAVKLSRPHIRLVRSLENATGPARKPAAGKIACPTKVLSIITQDRTLARSEQFRPVVESRGCRRTIAATGGVWHDQARRDRAGVLVSDR
jgi:hypothetical protein